MIIRAEKLSSLGVLSAGAAHEILNPANIIGIRAKRMEEKYPESDWVNGSAKIILRNVKRIAQICDDLRRFSRDEMPEMIAFNPNEIVQECMEFLGHDLRLMSIDTKLVLSGEGVAVNGDRHQIQQVFMNLISNAKDAMASGGTLTVVSDVTDYDGKRHWECNVIDTGEGIPEESRTLVFDPFFTTKSEEKGTGLGLSISHGIIENHRGRIWLEDNSERGSRFSVSLPILEKEL